ncbi:transcriptional activator NhaR [Bryobacterales bacterium F-183]|nr:transcriptional activator NhaR [Bryobacterales bacterium F-183]
MDWLNYHHLLYFWTVAKEGSITRASQQLDLAQPTISAQLHTLEEAFGEPLFVRTGRNLVLTDFGRLVYRYAEQIFGLGKELQNAVQTRPSSRVLRLTVGIAEVLPKSLVHKILQPALEMDQPVQLVCHEDKPERLLAEMNLLGLDLVLSDTPVPAGSKVRAFGHLLGSCGVTFLASPAQADRLSGDFPGNLNGAPLLLPVEGTALRRGLDNWFAKLSIKPSVIAEFHDSSLIEAFGHAGSGIFVVPERVADDISRVHQLVTIGTTTEVEERFFAISADRKFRHPAVQAISDAARANLFPMATAAAATTSAPTTPPPSGAAPSVSV